MGQIDYALIVTILALLWLILRHNLPGGGVMIAFLFFSLPTIVFYMALKALFVAIGFMRPI